MVCRIRLICPRGISSFIIVTRGRLEWVTLRLGVRLTLPRTMRMWSGRMFSLLSLLWAPLDIAIQA